MLNLAVVQLLSYVSFFVTPWTVAHQALLSSTISQSLLRFMSIKLVMLSNHLILCCPLLLCLQSFPASESFPKSWLFTSDVQNIGASASASVFSMNIQWILISMNIQWILISMNIQWILISFRIDWFDLLEVQGTLKSLLQHQVQKHQFFSAQLSL